MKNRKLKTLAAALAMTLAIGTIPPVSDTTELPAIITTVEAATRKVSLKVSNKRAYVGKTTKVSAKATKGAKLSYKTSNKKIATVSSKGVITGKKAGTVKITITAKKIKIQDGKKGYYSKGVPPETEDHCTKCKTDSRTEKEPEGKSPYKDSL